VFPPPPPPPTGGGAALHVHSASERTAEGADGQSLRPRRPAATD